MSKAIKPYSISENEKYILEILRSLAPFERFEVVADKGGKVNNYMIIRSTKTLLTDKEPFNVA